MTNNTWIFIFIVLVIVVAIGFLLSGGRNSRHLSGSTFIALIISVISTISMAVNYLAAFTGRLDGIGLTGWLAKLIIGEGRWSVEMFFSYFEAATAISLLLLFIYFAALLYEKRRYNS